MSHPIVGRDLLRPGDRPATVGARAFAACGGYSMLPTLGRWDLIELEASSGEDVRTGDVIWFDDGGGPVVHRVLLAMSGQLVTCGDNNRTLDSIVVQRSWVQARVVAALGPDGRREVAGGWRGLVASLLGRCARWRVPMARPLEIEAPTVIRTGGGEALLYVGARLAGWYDPDAGRWRLGTWVTAELDPELLPMPQP